MVEAVVRDALAQVEGTAQFTIRLHLLISNFCKPRIPACCTSEQGDSEFTFTGFARSHARWLPGANTVRDGGRAARNQIRIVETEFVRMIEPENTNRLEGLLRRVKQTQVVRSHGRVVQLIGLVIESEGPLAAVGELCRIESGRHDGSTLAEVVGFRNHHVLLMPLGEVHGIHPGSEVIALGTSLRVPVGDALKGRVIDGLGQSAGRPWPDRNAVSVFR